MNQLESSTTTSKYSTCTYETLRYIQQHPEAKAILHLALRDGRNSLFTKNCPTRPEILRGSDILFRWCDAIRNLGNGKRAREKFRDEATASMVKNALQILVTELWCPMSASAEQLRIAMNGGYRSGKGVLTSALKQARIVITELRDDLGTPYDSLSIPHSPKLNIQLPQFTIPKVKIEGHDSRSPTSAVTLATDFTLSRLELGSHKELTPTSTSFSIPSQPLRSHLSRPNTSHSPSKGGVTTIGSPPLLPLPSMSTLDTQRDREKRLPQPTTISPQVHFLNPRKETNHSDELTDEKDIATVLLLMKDQTSLSSPRHNQHLAQALPDVSWTRTRSLSRSSSFGGKLKRDDSTDTDVNETDDDGSNDSTINEQFVTCGSCPYLSESQPSENESYESFVSMMIQAGYASHLLTDPCKLDDWLSHVIFLMNYELVGSDTPRLYHRRNLTSISHPSQHIFRLMTTQKNADDQQGHARICYGDLDANEILFSRSIAVNILNKLRRCGEIVDNDEFPSNKRLKCE